MIIFKIILVICFCIVDIYCDDFWVGKRQGTRQATFERFDNTCGNRDVLVTFNHGGMLSVHGKIILNSTITIKKDIDAELEIKFCISKCKYKENLDSCEYVLDTVIHDYCKRIESKNTLWGSYFRSYVPEFKCPFRKAVYRSVNGTIDLTALLLFPIDAWYWRVKFEAKDKTTQKLVTCVIVETRISTVYEN